MKVTHKVLHYISKNHKCSGGHRLSDHKVIRICRERANKNRVKSLYVSRVSLSWQGKKTGKLCRCLPISHLT